MDRDQRRPNGGARSRLLVTWAIALAVLGVLELGARRARGTTTLPYGNGDHAYRALGPELRERGAAPVSVVGSSRAREALLAPVLAEAWAGTEVANYSLAGAHAADVEVVVHRLLAATPKPRLVVYGMTPRQLVAGPDPWDGQQPYLWLVRDWWRERSRYGKGADRFLADAVKNELAQRSLLFSFRGELVAALQDDEPGALSRAFDRLWSTRPSPHNPMRGGLPRRQAGHQRLASRIVTAERIREYIGNRYENPAWPHTRQLAHVEAIVRACQAERVSVVLVEVPVNPLLSRHLPPGTEDGFRTVMRELAQETGIRFVEVSSLGEEFAESDFREQSHMNARGAHRFSRAVGQALQVESRAAGDRAER